MIGGVNSVSARDAWVLVPGRSYVPEYDDNGNPTKITYYDGVNVVFVQYYTYDDNGNCIKVECKNN
jgi:hypothetical protein